MGVMGVIVKVVNRDDGSADEKDEEGEEEEELEHGGGRVKLENMNGPGDLDMRSII
jgi:hypothetical protein